MKPTILSGSNIKNPGNGFFRIGAPNQFIPIRSGFSSITISQPDPAVALEGTIVLSMGNKTETLDLSADRWLSLSGIVPHLEMTISGVDASADFYIMLS